MLWKEQAAEWRIGVNLTRQKYALGGSLGGEKSLAYAISRDAMALEKTFACGQGGNASQMAAWILVLGCSTLVLTKPFASVPITDSIAPNASDIYRNISALYPMQVPGLHQVTDRHPHLAICRAGLEKPWIALINQKEGKA